MLKIKDNVDLKELELFGFIPQTYCNAIHYELKLIKDYKWLRVNGLTRIISLNNDSVNISLPNVLYDMMRDNLVEKVEEVSNE